ncbi:hypothetical protein QR680_019011 [Steinernema hermaphroditum]|uniref:SEP domain-containing protein n=1 Tax=Steinernema hermaphroditum TaxID=289476 RepID=A0AA39LRX6_9BILA|nr:hypothetical protein QR680_019011 [Steinernema hermaphroditum]
MLANRVQNGERRFLKKAKKNKRPSEKEIRAIKLKTQVAAVSRPKENSDLENLEREQYYGIEYRKTKLDAASLKRFERALRRKSELFYLPEEETSKPVNHDKEVLRLWSEIITENDSPDRPPFVSLYKAPTTRISWRAASRSFWRSSSTLVEMSESEFEEYKEPFRRKTEKVKCKNYRQEIESKRFSFDDSQLQVAESLQIRREDLLDFYERTIVAGAERRKVSIWVLSAAEHKGPCVEGRSGTVEIENLERFKDACIQKRNNPLNSAKKDAKDEDATVSSSQAVQLFASARDSGAEVERQKPEERRSFASRGYRLGGLLSPMCVVPPQQVTLTLKLWEDGFSIDDGPLRRFDAPENAEFVAEVRRGHIPKELQLSHKGSRLDVRMMCMARRFADPKRRVSFVEEGDTHKRPKIAAFFGKGHLLGGPSGGDAPKPKKPKTRILSGQSVLICLPSGRRVATEFGPSETVADLRSYILKMDPMLENRPFRLINAATRREIPIGESSLSSERLFKTLVIVRLDPK